MQQLSGSDSVMLVTERRNIYNHVGGLLVYDVSTAPGGKVRFRDILRHFDARLHLHPVFRRRLVPVPLDIDRPYWVTDPDLDLEYHIRHIALPKPGDWRQLMIQVARLHSRPLDRSRPLWEAYVIEGLDNVPKLPPGAFAVFLKLHHAAVDGMAAVHLMKELHSTTPGDVEFQTTRTVIADRNPTNYELLARSIDNRVAQLNLGARLSARIGLRLLAAGRSRWPEIARGQLQEVIAAATDLVPRKAPATRFSGPVSAHRVMEAFGMPLSRIKRIRQAVPGSTLNDIFIAVAGGAVRKYLQAKGELPEESLVALMPISLRSDASAGGNEVSGVPVKACSDIADPIERLRCAREESATSKLRGERMGLDLLKNLLDVLPSPAATGLWESGIVRSVNMTISNVRGPDQAMYLAGAKAMCMYPVSIPADGAGLNFTGVSYNGVMWVSMVSCRTMVPDPGFFLECMRGAWEDLLAAAGALPVGDGSSARKAPATPPVTSRKPRRRPPARPRAGRATRHR